MQVLILEDNLFFVPQLESRLRTLGCEFDLAVTASTAMEKLSDRYAVVIVDLHTTGSLEFIRAIKAQFNAPVLGFCGHSEVDLRKAAKEAGVDHLIPNSELLTATSAILARISSSKAPAEETEHLAS